MTTRFVEGREGEDSGDVWTLAVDNGAAQDQSMHEAVIGELRLGIGRSTDRRSADQAVISLVAIPKSAFHAMSMLDVVGALGMRAFRLRATDA